MIDFLQSTDWTPYLAGAGIGVLSWIAFLVSDKPLACSTSFARTAGMIEKLFRRTGARREYFKRFKPEVDWQWMLVLGVFIGSLLSALLSNGFAFSSVPALWMETFGESWELRYLWAFIGGVLVGIGSRWAGGCTSGHGISGTMQLTLSSWLAVVIFFASGILFSQVIFNLFGATP